MTIIKHKEAASVAITGHVHIEDDLNYVHLDQYNAIHPQNLARILSRALANETNSWIYRMAFGNGGTVVDELFDVTLKTANDGLYPDPATWTSRLYNETYTEVISDNTIGSETFPQNTGPNTLISTKNISNPLESKVIVTVVLGQNEPRSQSVTDNLSPQDVVDNTFTFDEIGLFSPGKPNISTQGRCDIDMNAGTVQSSVTGLSSGITYTFSMAVDAMDVENPTYVPYIITFDGLNDNEITYQVLMDAINTSIIGAGVSVTMVEPSTGVVDGHLKFLSKTTGADSNVFIKEYEDGIDSEDYLFRSQNLTTFQDTIISTLGSDAGQEDNSTDMSLERERLLTHITFVPVIKSANRTFVITYTITINVVQSG